MYPNIKPDQLVLGFNWVRVSGFRTGELVVAKAKGRLIVKRIRRKKGNRFFLTGDNEEASTDSRQFGWISRSAIIAKVIRVYS